VWSEDVEGFCTEIDPVHKRSDYCSSLPNLFLQDEVGGSFFDSFDRLHQQIGNNVNETRALGSKTAEDLIKYLEAR
jgi:hypothetical protein